MWRERVPESFPGFSYGDGIGDPFQIVRRSVFDCQADAFRHLIGVEFCNRVTDLAEGRGRSLNDQKPFASFFHVALPAIDGRDLWDDVDASGQASIYQRAGNFTGFFFRSGGREDDSFVGHIESAFRYRLSAVSP